MATSQKYKQGAAINIHYVISKIYTLADTKGNVFYVGCTKGMVADRLAGHISEARKSKIKSAKSTRIIELDFDITATIIDSTVETLLCNHFSNKKGQALENVWIQKYLDLGYNLLNVRRPNPAKKEPAKEEIGTSINSKDLQPHTFIYRS